jgi:hypothetical protein
MTTQDPPTDHDDRTRDELATLAQADLEGRHGCIDSPTDIPQPCQPCSWCHRTGSPRHQRALHLT